MCPWASQSGQAAAAGGQQAAKRSDGAEAQRLLSPCCHQPSRAAPGGVAMSPRGKPPPVPWGVGKVAADAIRTPRARARLAQGRDPLAGGEGRRSRGASPGPRLRHPPLPAGCRPPFPWQRRWHPEHLGQSFPASPAMSSTVSRVTQHPGAGSGRQVEEDLSPPTAFCCAQPFATRKQSTGGRAVPVRWPVVALGGCGRAAGRGWQAPGLLFPDPGMGRYGKWPGSLGGSRQPCLSRTEPCLRSAP